jgi:hypothetical protein
LDLLSFTRAAGTRRKGCRSGPCGASYAPLVADERAERARWGLSFMSTLQREMTEDGVEPRQIFAYDGAAKKNAADIELVIDALHIAY